MPRQPQQPGRKKTVYGGGSVYQRKDGRYVATIKDPNTGRRIERYAQTQKEAEKKLEDIKFEIRQNTLATGPRQTVAQYLHMWLEEVHRPEVEEISFIHQSGIVGIHLVPALGHLQLKSLTAQHVQQLYTSLFKKGYKSNTIHAIHSVLHKALRNAVRWKLVSANVADQVTIPRNQKEEARVARALTAEQALYLLERCTEYLSALFWWNQRIWMPWCKSRVVCGKPERACSCIRPLCAVKGRDLADHEKKPVMKSRAQAERVCAVAPFSFMYRFQEPSSRLALPWDGAEGRCGLGFRS